MLSNTEMVRETETHTTPTAQENRPQHDSFFPAKI